MSKIILVMLALLGICFNYFPANSKQDNSKIHCYEISELFPYINKQGGNNGYDTPVVRIFSKGNMMIQQIFYKSYFYGQSPIAKKIEKNRLYYLFYNGSKYGLYYDSSNNILGEKLNLDSAFATYWHYNVNIYSLLNSVEHKLVYKNNNEKEGSLKEVYAIKAYPNSGYIDTCTLTYDKRLINIPYSFSRELDSINASKLIRATITKYPNPANKNITEYVESAYWVKEIPVPNEQEIMRLFDELKRSGIK